MEPGLYVFLVFFRFFRFNRFGFYFFFILPWEPDGYFRRLIRGRGFRFLLRLFHGGRGLRFFGLLRLCGNDRLRFRVDPGGRVVFVFCRFFRHSRSGFFSVIIVSLPWEPNGFF